MNPTLSFHGAAGCVTGSCFRLQTEDAEQAPTEAQRRALLARLARALEA